MKADPHRTLNSCRGVIECSDLKSLTKDEIVDGLRLQGVTDCFNITVKSDNNNTDRCKTNTFILTFKTATAPTHINVRYLRVKVERYIPNPLRCFKCQKFGHSTRFCKQELISRLDSRTLPFEPRHRCTSSVLSTCLRNDVLASCLLTKHTPDDVIVTHALLSQSER